MKQQKRKQARRIAPGKKAKAKGVTFTVDGKNDQRRAVVFAAPN